MATYTGKLKRYNGSSYDILHPETTWEQVYKGSGDQKIPQSYLPALAITSSHVVANEAAQLALDVQEGDIAIRTDESKSYIALNSNNSSMADWRELQTPADSVLSVDGQTGIVDLSGLYAPIAHNHNGTYALISHGHSISDITNLQNELTRIENVAFAAIGTVAPSNPEVGTLWIDTN